MKRLVTALFFLILGQLTYAHGGHEHTPAPQQDADFCSEQNPDVCAHAHFPKNISSEAIVEFIVHIEDAKKQTPNNVKVDLWMDLGNGDGHGTEPVSIEPLKGNKYKIKNAKFIMVGTWLVKVSFNLANEAYQINIPVEILQ